MEVRDLIYLLQTKAKPEDEVHFFGDFRHKNGITEISGNSDDDFITVANEDGRCMVNIGSDLSDKIESYFKAN